VVQQVAILGQLATWAVQVMQVVWAPVVDMLAAEVIQEVLDTLEAVVSWGVQAILAV
jgi:hypothetical protein